MFLSNVVGIVVSTCLVSYGISRLGGCLHMIWSGIGTRIRTRRTDKDVSALPVMIVAIKSFPTFYRPRPKARGGSPTFKYPPLRY